MRVFLFVRAVSQDPSVARMMGINSDRLSLLVTSLSAAFAGIAGVLVRPFWNYDASTAHLVPEPTG